MKSHSNKDEAVSGTTELQLRLEELPELHYSASNAATCRNAGLAASRAKGKSKAGVLR
jgi:hypothetical protein